MSKMMTDFVGSKLFITGGTGSFGQALVAELMKDHSHVKEVTVFSRDEYKQYQMRRRFPLEYYPRLRFVLGDIRDQQALSEALEGTDTVIHAAALKQNPAGELYPDEFYKTNVEGTRHLIRAAKATKVERVLALSTDKAVYPTSAYGASKLCAEKLLLAANEKSKASRFSVMRLGNLLGSRASVMPALLEAHHEQIGQINITHPDMTRFSLTLSQSLTYCTDVLSMMQGGEIFVPKMSAYRLRDLVRALLPEVKVVATGPRASEKMHELALSTEEARFGYAYQEFFVICPDPQSHSYWKVKGRKLEEDFAYSSDHPERLLKLTDLRHLIEHTK
jgi:FlaA1/EpsC-like NDP-sugar epimerase